MNRTRECTYPGMFAALLLSGFALAEDVIVSSNVEGASILLNGNDTGKKTPATLTGIAPGPIQVSVRAGCVVGSANLTLSPRQTLKVSLFAVEQGGALILHPHPADIRLFVDDAPVPNDEKERELACGHHAVRAERDGYVTYETTVEIAPDGVLDLPITLTAAPDPVPVAEPEPTPVPYYKHVEPKPKPAPAPASTAPAAAAAPATAAAPAPTSSSTTTTRPKSRHGLRVAATVVTAVGAVDAMASVFFFNQADVAYDAWDAKDAAARRTGDAALATKADTYYENVFVPKATAFYVAGASSLVLLGSGVLMFVVDAPVAPALVPGGALLTWRGSF